MVRQVNHEFIRSSIVLGGFRQYYLLRFSLLVLVLVRFLLESIGARLCFCLFLSRQESLQLLVRTAFPSALGGPHEEE